MTPKDPFLEGNFWDKFWRPIRSRALLFTPDMGHLALLKHSLGSFNLDWFFLQSRHSSFEGNSPCNNSVSGHAYSLSQSPRLRKKKKAISIENCLKLTESGLDGFARKVGQNNA